MVQPTKYKIILVILFAHLLGSVSQAQNMQHTVVEHKVKFAPGKTKSILQGKADYAMSYVYHVGARKGQIMEVHLISKGRLVRFSIIAPKETKSMNNAFAVSNWKGNLPESGDYTIVVVMNQKERIKVAYALEVAIK